MFDKLKNVLKTNKGQGMGMGLVNIIIGLGVMALVAVALIPAVQDEVNAADGAGNTSVLNGSARTLSQQIPLLLIVIAVMGVVGAFGLVFRK